MNTENVAIHSVSFDNRMREVDEGQVERLADSMQLLGQLSPIIVYPAENETNETLVLVAGAHRLAAARKLGWAHIPARVMEADGLITQLAEIDENLCRATLTPTQEAEHLAKRKEIWEAMRERGGNARCGSGNTLQSSSVTNESDAVHQLASSDEIQVAQVGSPEIGYAQPPSQDAGFAAETGHTTGKSKTTINRAIHRASAVCQPARDLIRGTSLDTGVFLDALAQQDMSDDEQVAHVKKALAALTDRTDRTEPDETCRSGETPVTDKKGRRQARVARKQARVDCIDFLHDTLSVEDRDQIVSLIHAAGGQLTLKASELRDGAATKSGVTAELVGLGGQATDEFEPEVDRQTVAR